MRLQPLSSVFGSNQIRICATVSPELAFMLCAINPHGLEVLMAPDKTKLSPDQLTALLRDLPDWKLEDGQLVRTWTFKDFVAAIAFVNRIAELAEQAGHHPDIDIRYNKVKLALVSHDAGGITVRDADMARQVGEIS